MVWSPRAAVVALAVLVFLAPSSGAWYQLHGGPDRNAVWLVPDEPLDVLAYRSVLSPDESLTTLLGPNFSLTVDGLLTVARNTTDDTCSMLRLATGADVPMRMPLDGCRAPWFQGYDPIADTAFVCAIQGPDRPVLQARDAKDGSLRWGIVPNRDLAVADVPGTLFWGCSGVAFDFARREAVVPFINARTGLEAWHHRVAAVDLDTGAVKWVTQIPVTAEVTGGLVPTDQPVEGTGFYIIPLSATLAANGAVITAIVICPDIVTCDVPPTDNSRQPAPFQTAAAWLDNKGIVQGLAFARRNIRSSDVQGQITQGTAGGAFWASAQGTLAVASLGGSIILINPESKERIATVGISTSEQPLWGVDSLPAPVWAGNLILAPFYRTVTAFNAATYDEEWRWATGQPGWLVQDLLAAPNGDVYVLVGKSDRSSRVTYGIQGTESMVVRLDRDGHELQRLPVTVETWMTTEPDMMIPGAEQGFAFPRPPVLVPIPDGLAVSDLSGHLVEIGPTDGTRRPVVDVEDKYPRPGTSFALRVPPLPSIETQRVLVQWGDGYLDESTAPEEGDSFTFRHVFGNPQRHEVLITAVYGDGTTGTTAVLIDVGGTPPPDLNFLQHAFARENLDMTFGVLGIAIALAGALYGASRRMRRRAHLQREMRLTDAAFAAAGEHMAAREAALDARREAIQAMLERGRLDEAQTQVLLRQVDDRRRQARLAPLDDRFDYLPRGLARRMESLLADGRISKFEHERFLVELEAEVQLTGAQKAQVKELLDGWRRHDQGA